jgi:hypothetical protein
VEVVSRLVGTTGGSCASGWRPRRFWRPDSAAGRLELDCELDEDELTAACFLGAAFSAAASSLGATRYCSDAWRLGAAARAHPTRSSNSSASSRPRPVRFSFIKPLTRLAGILPLNLSVLRCIFSLLYVVESSVCREMMADMKWG